MTRLRMVVAGVALGCRAWAATSEGSLITNAVTATYAGQAGLSSPSFVMSFAATATAIVENPCTQVLKTVGPALVGSGGTLTYQIAVLNCSTTHTSFAVTATDQLPPNTAYAGLFLGWGGGAGTWAASSSPDGVTYGAGLPAAGQGQPFYLRWTLDVMPPAASAWVRFAVKVL